MQIFNRHYLAVCTTILYTFINTINTEKKEEKKDEHEAKSKDKDKSKSDKLTEVMDIDEDDVKIVGTGNKTRIEISDINGESLKNLYAAYEFKNIGGGIFKTPITIYHKMVKYDGICIKNYKYPVIINYGKCLDFHYKGSLVLFIFQRKSKKDSSKGPENFVYRIPKSLILTDNPKKLVKFGKINKALDKFDFHRYGNPIGPWYEDPVPKYIGMLLLCAGCVSLVSIITYKLTNYRLY